MIHRLAGRRTAFTLVELLVVIAIIGVLVALLLPAVQAAREAARRMQCTNNLKQLGLAIHNHHDVMGIFPPSEDERFNASGGKIKHSWVPHILPFIEQKALHEQYRFDRDWDNKATNDAAGGPIKVSLPTFLCPSAPGKNQREQNENRGCLDYPATTERYWQGGGNPFVSATQAQFVKTSDPYFIGVLGHNKITGGSLDPCRRRFADITDGTSNTFLLAECAGRNQKFHMGKRITPKNTRGPWANPGSRININGCDPNDATALYGPKAVNCINDKEIYAFHPGGANACMADASVRLVSQSTSLDIVLALLTRGRGEVISDF